MVATISQPPKPSPIARNFISCHLMPIARMKLGCEGAFPTPWWCSLQSCTIVTTKIIITLPLLSNFGSSKFWMLRNLVFNNNNAKGKPHLFIIFLLRSLLRCKCNRHHNCSNYNVVGKGGGGGRCGCGWNTKLHHHH